MELVCSSREIVTGTEHSERAGRTRNSAPVAFGQACNRSLSAPFAHIEGSTHLGPGKPVAPQLSDPCSVNLGTWPPEPLPLGARIAQSGLNPLLDERPLELCHGADDLEHQAIKWALKYDAGPDSRRARIAVGLPTDCCPKSSPTGSVQNFAEKASRSAWTCCGSRWPQQPLLSGNLQFC